LLRDSWGSWVPHPHPCHPRPSLDGIGDARVAIRHSGGARSSVTVTLRRLVRVGLMVLSTILHCTCQPVRGRVTGRQMPSSKPPPSYARWKEVLLEHAA
jgi:hypothetical protein